MSRCSEMNETFPYMWPGWSAEKVGSRYVVIPPPPPPGGSGASPGGKRKLIRRGGSAARISNRARPITLVVVRCSSLPLRIWPWCSRCYNLHHSHSLKIGRDGGICGVGRCDQEASGSDCVQQDSWTRSGSDLPQWGESAVSVDSAVRFVGGPASALLSGADGCTDFVGEVAVAVTSPAIFCW